MSSRSRSVAFCLGRVLGSPRSLHKSQTPVICKVHNYLSIYLLDSKINDCMESCTVFNNDLLLLLVLYFTYLLSW